MKSFILQLIISGKVIHQIDIKYNRNYKYKEGASGMHDQYHQAITILRRIADRQDQAWEIHKVIKSKAGREIHKYLDRPLQPIRSLGNYSNKDHIIEALIK